MYHRSLSKRLCNVLWESKCLCNVPCKSVRVFVSCTVEVCLSICVMYHGGLSECLCNELWKFV